MVCAALVCAKCIELRVCLCRCSCACALPGRVLCRVREVEMFLGSGGGMAIYVFLYAGVVAEPHLCAPVCFRGVASCVRGFVCKFSFDVSPSSSVLFNIVGRA